MSIDLKITNAWRNAAADLGIRVVAPFTLMMPGGTTKQFEAHILDFGSPKGAVVASPISRADHEPWQPDVWFSVLGEGYRTYNRQLFIDTLDDWGWHGKVEEQPLWYSGTPWTGSLMKPVVIAVDGTAASGKGTLAKKLAAHFGFHHLDSGSLYRLVALGVIEAKGDPNKEADALKAACVIDPARGNDTRIRSAEIGQAASLVSVFPSVRAELLAYQRKFAARSPGAVIDGRDIGTVVCPDATAKLFVDAKPDVRAHRRWLELKAAGAAPAEAEILKEIVARDARDRGRALAPMKAAADAVLLDTSALDIDAAFKAALAIVQPKVEEALKAPPQG
jgi:CMP/dCMP kinase